MKKIFCLLFAFLFSAALFGQYVQPESAIWDNVNKRYYITNAGAGTITMRDWGGKTHLSWANGLIQPKAMLIIDSTLYVVDYTTMKTFNINTARLLKNETVPGATFMNDICMDNDGNFYITETYDNSIIKYDAKRKKYSKLALKGFIQKPNGIIFDGNRLVIVSFRPDAPIQAISLADFTVTTLVETEIDYMDGIAKDGKGNVFFSAWNDQNPGSGKVYKMKDDFTGDIETVISNLDGPADIYYNQLSDTLVVPNMDGSYVQFYSFIDPPPAPELIAPDNGSRFNKLNLLKWKEARAAKTYTLQTADNYLFEDAFELQEIPSTEMEIELSYKQCDTLYWRVKAINTEGESDWSEAWFMIPPLPVTPVPLQPADGAVDIATKTEFAWQYIEQPFKLIIDTTDDFSSAYKMEFDVNDSVFTMPANLLPDTEYYWKLESTICDETATGPVWSFTTINDSPPGKPVLTNPEDESEDIQLEDVEFEWEFTENTEFYIFTLAADQNFKIIVEQDTVLPAEGDDLTHNIENTLDCNKDYFWKVTAYNQYGETVSDVYTFKTLPCTGVEDMDINGTVIIPNPAKSHLRIETHNELTPGANVVIIDTKGITHKPQYSISGNIIKIDNLDILPAGSYFIKITSGNRTNTYKLMIER